MIRLIKLEDLKSWKRLSCVIVGIGILSFIILTLIAMLVYPDNYSFTGHYFSDLGTTVTIKNGFPNDFSRSLFIIACLIAGLSLIFFWIVFSTLFIEDKLQFFLSFSGSLIGIISSFFLIALAFFPYNVYPIEHSLTTKLFFSLFPIAILISSIVFFFNKFYYRIFTFLSLIFCIFCILNSLQIYPQVIFLNSKKIYLNPSIQKFIVYGYWFWIIFHIIKIWKSLKIFDICINYL